MKEFKSYYKDNCDRKYNTWCKYTKSIDTYGCGCQHECCYCYAKALLDFRKNWNPIEPKISYITEIEKTISELSKNDVVRIGKMTDCFQPIEKIEAITYETIKLLNKYSVNYLIVTKSSLVSTDKYLNIYDGELAHFQISMSSTDDKISSEYEKCTPTSERINAVEKLYKLGFDVSIRLSPFVYQFVDFKILNKIDCSKILVEFLKVNHFIKKSFNIDYSDYSLKYGGYNNLQLDKKVELIKNVDSFEELSVGEYVKEHHEYFSNNVNYNKNDCCNLKLRKNVFEPKQEALSL
jgi:DNA repair photolyase